MNNRKQIVHEFLKFLEEYGLKQEYLELAVESSIASTVEDVPDSLEGVSDPSKYVIGCIFWNDIKWVLLHLNWKEYYAEWMWKRSGEKNIMHPEIAEKQIIIEICNN